MARGVPCSVARFVDDHLASAFECISKPYLADNKCIIQIKLYYWNRHCLLGSVYSAVESPVPSDAEKCAASTVMR